MTDCIAQGTAVPPELIGALRDSSAVVSQTSELVRRFAEDGYVYIRSVIDRDDVLAARSEVLSRLNEVGEIRSPAADGIATGISRRREMTDDLGAFWQSVSQGPRLRQVSHGPQIGNLMTAFFSETARPHDYIFLRPGVVGRSTHLHYDLPFFARGSDRIHTVWTALGNIPLDEGPLMVLENSQHFDELIEPIQTVDYESNESPVVQVLADTVEFTRSRNSRLLTTDFAPGDVVIFGMTTMHGTLDNHSPVGRVRLSCDVRWQPATDPVDERYVGSNPAGTTGAGYGELNGAKPLTDPWHIR